MTDEGLHCPATIPSWDMVKYPRLGLGVYHSQLDKGEKGLIGSHAVGVGTTVFVIVHSISCRIPSCQLIGPNDVGNRTVVAAIDEG